MPKVDDIGFSEITPLKMDVLKKIFSMHISITQAVIAKNSYYKNIYRYIDLTAGKGIVPKSNMYGSPLLFLDVVAKDIKGWNFSMDFIESKSNNYDDLNINISKFPNLMQYIRLHEGKYQEIIPSLLQNIDKSELGLVFVDPSGNLPDFKTLKYISDVRPRMELLLYLSTTNIKRLPYKKSLEEYMNEINKQYWLVRRPIHSDKFGWTFLLGSNTDKFKSYMSIEFHRFDSNEAKSFFPILNLSKKQRQEKLQPKLPSL
jgi:three-Cys-motif partner protein